jgi:hypothetical protein
MMKSIRLLGATALMACILLPARAETRRAILVGIDVYNPDNPTKSQLRAASKPSAVKRPTVKGNPLYWAFDDLRGAVADVELMKALLTNLGFQDFVVLEDQDATADAILTALQKNLVDDAAPGDIRVFYYSGHGNHIGNTASAEHGEDQTIVPADHWNDVPDIRDKEISRILWKAARKGVKVTFIADSCHSGSLSRGAWNGRGQARTTKGSRDGEIVGGVKVPYKEPSVNDPADIDPQTRKPIDPEALGVLTLAAAQQFEEALELDTDGGRHGAFTWALSQSLKSAKEPMDRVYSRTLALMRGSAVAQQPVMGGIGRGAKGVFGDDADPRAGVEVSVSGVNGKDGIRINGGIALGLYPGSTLKSGAKPPVSLEIVSSDGLGSSAAKIVGMGSVRVGDVLTVDHVTMPSARLKVYIPHPIPPAALAKTVAEMGKLQQDPSVGWLTDATAGRPTDVMSWNGSQWLLDKNPAVGPSLPLGPAPTAEAVKRLLQPNRKFLLLLPPSAELAAAIHLGDANSSTVQPIATSDGAQYWFNGRLNGDDIEYAWILPDSVEEGMRSLAGADVAQHPDGYTALPLRSDWVKLPAGQPELQAAGATMSDQALRLARIRAWFVLQAPPGQGSFPYHLALKNVNTGQFRDAGDLKDGEEYKIYLRADPKDVKVPNLTRRWVYVFAVDHFGKGSLIFPPLGRGNDGNFVPFAQKDEAPKFEPLIPVGGDSTMDFSIGEPFGVDTYFLLATEEALSNPAVLDFDGVRSKGGTRGGLPQDPLTQLLDETGAATRAPKPAPVPVRWSIERLTLRSVAAGQ